MALRCSESSSDAFKVRSNSFLTQESQYFLQVQNPSCDTIFARHCCRHRRLSIVFCQVSAPFRLFWPLIFSWHEASQLLLFMKLSVLSPLEFWSAGFCEVLTYFHSVVASLMKETWFATNVLKQRASFSTYFSTVGPEDRLYQGYFKFFSQHSTNLDCNHCCRQLHSRNGDFLEQSDSGLPHQKRYVFLTCYSSTGDMTWSHIHLGWRQKSCGSGQSWLVQM